MNEHHTRSIRKRSHLFSSPEKEHCYSCGREVKAGQMSRHFSYYPQCSVDIEGSRKRPASNHARRKKRRKRLQDTTADPTDIDSDGVDSDHHPRQLHHWRPSCRYVFPVSRNDSHGLIITTPEQHGEVTNWCGTASENPCEDFPVLDDEATPTVLGEVHQEDAPDSSIREFETTSSTEESEDEDAPDSSMLVAYQEHIDSVNDNGLNLSLFSREEKVQIDLLQTLSNLGAPMKAYEAIMQWTNRSVRSGHVFRDTAITSQKTVLSRVTKRLNRDRLIPVWETLYLPYSDVSVRVAYFSASAVFADLLSCRHLNTDTNYIFDGDWNPDHDPYAVPNGSEIGDLNTGRSYLKTHSSLCKNPHDMLIACPLVIDKTICDVGGSGRLPMEPITMQYGLMQHDVRKKPEAMRVLGYIHPLKKDLQPAEPGVAVELAPNAPLPMYKRCTNATWKVNEYHMQIDFILQQSGFLSLQERGIKWNIQYRGKSYPTVLHPFIPLIIGDTEGHDALCGHYKSRTGGVAQLCRACECPTMKSGWSKGRQFAKRKPLAINSRLVHAKSFDVLQSKSQHMLVNAFDKVRFGAHSDRGIFGACPGEILHLVLLGWFKYVVKSFFKQIGQNSVSGRKYSLLCQDIHLRAQG